jgi:hypothetical protein
MGKIHTHEIRKVARVKKPEVGGKRAHKPSANLQERRSSGTSGTSGKTQERGNKGKVKHILRISMPTGGKEPWKGAKTFTHTGCSITSCKSETRGRGDTGMHEAILHKGGTSRVLAKTIASKFSQ